MPQKHLFKGGKKAKGKVKPPSRHGKIAKTKKGKLQKPPRSAADKLKWKASKVGVEPDRQADGDWWWRTYLTRHAFHSHSLSLSLSLSLFVSVRLSLVRRSCTKTGNDQGDQRLQRAWGCHQGDVPGGQAQGGKHITPGMGPLSCSGSSRLTARPFASNTTAQAAQGGPKVK